MRIFKYFSDVRLQLMFSDDNIRDLDFVEIGLLYEQ
jgi:hypothetical protein